MQEMHFDNFTYAGTEKHLEEHSKQELAVADTYDTGEAKRLMSEPTQ